MIEEADDDIERVLAAVTPRNAPSHLRADVISAVSAELNARSIPKPRRQSWIERAVAASMLFSATTFLAVSVSESRRMAAWDQRPVVRSNVAELAATVASVSDEKWMRGVERYLLSHLPQSARPVSTAILKEVQEIELWAEGGPLAERSRGDEKTQDRI